jgi:hypothetical protein
LRALAQNATSEHGFHNHTLGGQAGDAHVSSQVALACFVAKRSFSRLVVVLTSILLLCWLSGAEKDARGEELRWRRPWGKQLL